MNTGEPTKREEILVGLISAIIGNNWLMTKSDDLSAYASEVIKAAFNVGFECGTFEDDDIDDCAAIFNALTGGNWSDFVAESEAAQETELAQNRAVIANASAEVQHG